MCISNERAIRAARAIKRFYHKYGIGHIVLLTSYITFLLFSAGIFMILESANVTRLRKRWQEAVTEHRKSFVAQEMVPQIFNNTKLLVFIHADKSQYLIKILNEKMSKYEDELKIRPPLPILPCNYINSLIFVCSTVTTIGYGYIYPTTDNGRYFSMLCAIVGIPFTLMVIKDLSYLIAILFRYPCVCLVYIWHIFRYCTLQPVDENELLRRIHGADAVPRSDYRLRLMDHLLNIPIMVIIMAMIGWATVGCMLVHFYLPNARTSLVLYFIFNSLTTIGVGDVKPGENVSLLLPFFAYLLVGLSLVSLFINLLHTKLSRAYWLPDRMYMPLTTKATTQAAPIYDIESFDSLDNLNFISDCPLNHYVTLGVLQSEDKCPLLGVIQKEHAYVDADTQTQNGGTGYVPRPIRMPSPEALLIDKPLTSQDDVNDLIVETYGARPARLIASGITK